LTVGLTESWLINTSQKIKNWYQGTGKKDMTWVQLRKQIGSTNQLHDSYHAD